MKNNPGSDQWFSTTFELWGELYHAQKMSHASREQLIELLTMSVAVLISFYQSTSVISVSIPTSVIIAMAARYFHKIPAARDCLSHIQFSDNIQIKEILNALESNHFLELEDDDSYQKLKNAFEQNISNDTKWACYYAIPRYMMIHYLSMYAPINSLPAFLSTQFYFLISAYSNYNYFLKPKSYELETLAGFKKLMKAYYNLDEKYNTPQLCYLTRENGKELNIIFTIQTTALPFYTRLALWSTELVMAAYTPEKGNNFFVIALPVVKQENIKEKQKYEKDLAHFFSTANKTVNEIKLIEKVLKHFPAQWKGHRPFEKKHLYFWFKNPPHDFESTLKALELNYEACPEDGILVELFTNNKSNIETIKKLDNSLNGKKPLVQESIPAHTESSLENNFVADFQGYLWKSQRHPSKNVARPNDFKQVTHQPTIKRNAHFNLPDELQKYQIIHLGDTHFYVAIPPELELDDYTNWKRSGKGFVNFILNGKETECIKSHNSGNDTRYIAAPFMEGEYESGTSKDSSKPRLYKLFSKSYSHKELESMKKLPLDVKTALDRFILEQTREAPALK